MTLPPACVALQEAAVDLPDSVRAQIQPAIEAVCEDACRRRRILSLVQGALGQLRLDIKYLIFDLECTRKERDEAINK